MFDLPTFGCEVCSSVFQEDPYECAFCSRVFCAECLSTAESVVQGLACGICSGKVTDTPFDPTAVED